MPAYRNVRLCSKDCMCLYVCPTGATDTEDSVIDVSKCLPSCMECVKSCPSGAISMIPERYPQPQPKAPAVVATQQGLGMSKVLQEQAADHLAEAADNAKTRQFAKAVAISNRRMAEDILRESGYLLPQGTKVRELLESIEGNADQGFPIDALELLLEKL